ncbi:unnamed protein product [Paramecium pentaurelia]|uniref:Uncharacterized protein n=1 Tax=Paramecium pentaurelia TaxID=43138 RepID=A0A8S1UMJ0_9CILI|nr:unnamed protein product [Paramecium pentaurelia]
MEYHQEQVFGELEDCYQAFVPKKSKSKQQSESAEILELYHLTVEQIDLESKDIVDKKFLKLSNSILQWIEEELKNTTFQILELHSLNQQHHYVQIKFGFLLVDQANLYSVYSFYSSLVKKKEGHPILNSDCVEFTMEGGRIIDHSLSFELFDKIDYSLPDLLNHVLIHCAKQFKSNVRAHTSIFLISKYFVSEELSDLKKALLEEIKLRYPNTIGNIIFVLPLQSTATENYEITKIYSFSDPKKMFIHLLIKLISNPQIPLLSQEIYSLWEKDFKIYTLNYQQQLFKIKQAYFLMYETLHFMTSYNKKNTTMKELLDTLKNQPNNSMNYSKYLSKRKQLSDAILVFSKYIEQLKSENQQDIKDFKQKLFGLLCSNQASKWFTLSHDCKLNKAKQLFKDLTSIGYDQNIDQTILQYLENENYDKQQIKKPNDRFSQLTKDNEKVKFEDYVNEFLNQYIVMIINEIKKSYSQYIFKDFDKYLESTNPDILNHLHTNLIDTCTSNFKQTGENYAKIQQQYQVALSNLIEKQDMIDFQTAIANLKLLGLIEDTKRVKPTIQRAVYAKQMYINYNNEF